jgi:hypothetical protein
MDGMNEIAYFFVVIGISMLFGYCFAKPLYDLNLRIYRKWGWMELEEIWNRRKVWWLPTMQAVCLVVSTVSFIIAIILFII